MQKSKQIFKILKFYAITAKKFHVIKKKYKESNKRRDFFIINWNICPIRLCLWYSWDLFYVKQICIISSGSGSCLGRSFLSVIILIIFYRALMIGS